MKIKLPFIALLIAVSGFAQHYNFEWGPVIKSKTTIIDMYCVNGNSFYASTYGKRNKSKMLQYDNFNLTSSTIYKPVVDRRPSAFEGRFEFDEKILIFTSADNSERTKKTLYVHEFKKSAEPVEIEGKKVAEFDYDKQNKRRSGYTLLVSDNKQKICVSYYSSAKRSKDKDQGIYGYYILDNNLNIESKGSFEDILEESNESIDNYMISNDGELFMITKVNKPDEPAAMKFYKITGDEINALEINLEGNYASQLNIAVDNNENFVITGFFGKPYVKGVSKGTGVKGVFYAIMDPKTEEVLSSGFNEFDDAFIMEGLSQRQKDKTAKRQEKKGIEPSLSHFTMRYFAPTDDGGSFGLAEEYYVVVTTYRDPKTGATTTTYTYYYNDLIAFKLDKNGEMEWKKKIQKYQVSTNDNGYYSSIAVQHAGDHFYIMFNDNVANYDLASKKFLDKEIPQPMRISPKRNAIALVDLDITSGEVERTALGGQKEMGSILIPKLCHSEKDQPSILLYTRKGSSERFGRITFE